LNSGAYYQEIVKNINEQLVNANLQDVIRFQDFSDIIKFKNKDEAEKFIQGRNIDLIIWGGFTNDKLKKEGKLVNKLKLKFTYKHPGNRNSNFGKMIQLDINTKIAQKNYWQIMEDESYNDIEIISDNIFCITNYIIALSLKFFGKIKESIMLLEQFYKVLRVKEEDFIKHCELHLVDCYNVLGKNEYFLKNYSESILIMKKLLKFKPNDFNAIANIAVSYYKLRLVDKSRKYVDLMIKLDPNKPMTLLNTAFFKTLENEYDVAYKYYLKATKFNSEHLHYTPLDVVEFYDIEYSITKNVGCLYGAGVISFHYGDKLLAKEYFIEFLKKSNEVSAKLMKRKAERYLKRLDNIKELEPAIDIANS
jgi:tetratricopeptide (TPR) repeat protein